MPKWQLCCHSEHSAAKWIPMYRDFSLARFFASLRMTLKCHFSSLILLTAKRASVLDWWLSGAFFSDKKAYAKAKKHCWNRDFRFFRKVLVRLCKYKSYAFLNKFKWNFITFFNIFLDENIADLVQRMYVKPENVKGVWLSGIKYLQFLGKHLSVLGEEQSWSEVDISEVESLNLQL